MSKTFDLETDMETLKTAVDSSGRTREWFAKKMFIAPSTLSKCLCGHQKLGDSAKGLLIQLLNNEASDQAS